MVLWLRLLDGVPLPGRMFLSSWDWVTTENQWSLDTLCTQFLVHLIWVWNIVSTKDVYNLILMSSDLVLSVWCWSLHYKRCTIEYCFVSHWMVTIVSIYLLGEFLFQFLCVHVCTLMMFWWRYWNDSLWKCVGGWCLMERCVMSRFTRLRQLMVVDTPCCTWTSRKGGGSWWCIDLEYSIGVVSTCNRSEVLLILEFWIKFVFT